MAPASKPVQLSRDERTREYRCLRSAAESFTFKILEEIENPHAPKKRPGE
jgi:hypothetical protein